MSELNLADMKLQDIKHQAITESQLEKMKSLSKSYESLFSRRSRKYSELKLAIKNLNESDFKKLILSEYTFLKRPVFIINQQIFIGSDKATVERLKSMLG